MAPVGAVARHPFFLQDSSSFIAGERSALLRAFRETLPSQQAIGSLYHAVHQITGRMDQEACDVRKVGRCCCNKVVAMATEVALYWKHAHLWQPSQLVRVTVVSCSC